MTFSEPSRRPALFHRATSLATVRKAVVGLERFLAVGALAGAAMLFGSPDVSAFGMQLSLLGTELAEQHRRPHGPQSALQMAKASS